jgi:hypothetical protein
VRVSVDGRYALDPADAGLEVRALAMRVTAVREARDDEPEASMAVWLEGAVLEPPRRTRHPENRALELATTMLGVTIAERSAYPGSRAVIRRSAQVPVAVPLDHEGAGLLYRTGNRVRVEGALECLLEPQRGAAVDAAVRALDARYAAQQAQGDAPQGRIDERSYRARRRGLMAAPKPIVLAGYVEGLEHALPMTLDEAAEERRAFVRRLRERRARRDGQEVGAQEPETAPADAPPAAPLRPRRITRDAEG